MTLEDTPKEAKLHGLQCPLDASFVCKFPTLPHDASQTQTTAACAARPPYHFHAGNLTPGIVADVPAPQPNTQIIAKALANGKSGILKFEFSFLPWSNHPI